MYVYTGKDQKVLWQVKCCYNDHEAVWDTSLGYNEFSLHLKGKSGIVGSIGLLLPTGLIWYAEMIRFGPSYKFTSILLYFTWNDST